MPTIGTKRRQVSGTEQQAFRHSTVRPSPSTCNELCSARNLEENHFCNSKRFLVCSASWHRSSLHTEYMPPGAELPLPPGTGAALLGSPEPSGPARRPPSCSLWRKHELQHVNRPGAGEPTAALAFQQALSYERTFVISRGARGCGASARFSRAGGSEHRLHKAAATELLRSWETLPGPAPGSRAGKRPDSGPRGGRPRCPRGSTTRPLCDHRHRPTRAPSSADPAGRRRRANAPVSPSQKFAFTVPVGWRRGPPGAAELEPGLPVGVSPLAGPAPRSPQGSSRSAPPRAPLGAAPSRPAGAALTWARSFRHVRAARSQPRRGQPPQVLARGALPERRHPALRHPICSGGSPAPPTRLRR